MNDQIEPEVRRLFEAMWVLVSTSEDGVEKLATAVDVFFKTIDPSLEGSQKCSCSYMH